MKLAKFKSAYNLLIIDPRGLQRTKILTTVKKLMLTNIKLQIDCSHYTYLDLDEDFSE